MKTATLFSTLLLVTGVSAQAALYNSGFENGGVIYGDTTVWTDTRAVSGLAPVISSVTVTLNLSGVFNGDLYAYLSYNGAKLVLLNRVGVGTGSNPVFSFGFASAGFSGLVLADGGAGGDVHLYNGVGPGIFAADGRNVDPTSAPATLYGTAPVTFSSQFGGMNPNGNWSLVFADLSSGNQSTLNSWSLDITAVPEPVNVALGVFAVGALVVQGMRRWRGRARAGADHA